MATAQLMFRELSNLDRGIFHIINQLKFLKKGSNIDNIYKNVIKINNFQEISKDPFPVRLENLSNEEKNEINLFCNSTSYSVDEVYVW